VFSWRTTLSSNLFHNSPRQDVPSLCADLAFTLLTYGLCLSNLARSNVAALGSYEHEESTSDVERKAKDEKLNFAVNLLCRASGVFRHLSEEVLPEWERTGISPAARPPDITQPVTSALAKLALADAQTLAIRKLLSKAAYDNSLTPGPPLPKSHPSPGPIAKLYLECEDLYASARALVKSQGKTKGHENEEVSAELRHYLADEAQLCGALAHKWLGVDAGEHGGGDKCGVAIAFLLWAKTELEDLKDGGKGLIGRAKDLRERRKSKVATELASTTLFWKYYKNMNDTIHFQSIPPRSELQASIPAGRSAVAVKPYQSPTPAFGPGSVEHTRRQAESLELEELEGDNIELRSKAPGSPPSSNTSSYAGAGSYF